MLSKLLDKFLRKAQALAAARREEIECFVAGDLRRPGGEISARLEIFETIPHCQRGLLKQILCVLQAVNHAENESKDLAAMPREQLGKDFVAGGSARNSLLAGQEGARFNSGSSVWHAERDVA